jgi:hypothetical protein
MNFNLPENAVTQAVDAQQITRLELLKRSLN